MVEQTFSPDPPRLSDGAGSAAEQTGEPHLLASPDGYGWVTDISANVYTARTTLVTPQTEVVIAVPADLRSIRLDWMARSASVAQQVDAIFARFNGEVTTDHVYRTIFIQGQNTEVVATFSTGAGVALFGYADSDTADAGAMASGHAEFAGIDGGRIRWEFTSRTQPSAGAQWYIVGGGEYFGTAGRLTSISLFLESGAAFMPGSDVMVSGVKA